MAQLICISVMASLMINYPLIFLNFSANIFYAYCLIFPPHNGQRLKQPLKILLGVFVCCSIFYCVSLTILYILMKYESFKLLMGWVIVLSDVHNNMTCSVWLIFFYFIQIVPSQRASLIWIKRNIRSVIYTALFFSWMLFLVRSAIKVAHEISATKGYNNTLTVHNYELNTLGQAFFCVIRLYIFICMCIMMVSSFSTVRYLHRHIRSVAQGGSCFSTKKIKRQIRVTITGISQAVLYLVYDVYNLWSTLTNIFSPDLTISIWISFTVTTLYITGTTFNLGVGQAAFRLRVLGIWKKIKAMFGAGMVTNDVEIHSVNTR